MYLTLVYYCICFKGYPNWDCGWSLRHSDRMYNPDSSYLSNKYIDKYTEDGVLSCCDSDGCNRSYLLRNGVYITTFTCLLSIAFFF